MGDPISTTDLYEGTYYLLSGCELVAIEALRVNGAITCRLSFEGECLQRLQLEYFNGKAQVALFEFRRAFGQINALVHSAKKRARGQLRQERSAEGGAS